MKSRIVIAYDGGAAASEAISSLAAAERAEVIAVALDLGDGGELDALRQRALAAGAIRAHVLDARDEFARDYVVPALRAGALDRGEAALARLARPLVAQKLAEIAAIENATVADVDDLVISVPSALRGGRIGGAAADTAAHVEIEFTTGCPTAVNGVAMRVTELLESLTTIAAGHGIGSANELHGPAAAVLRAAYAGGDASDLTGTVRLRLFQGTCAVVDRVVLAEA
jgi:argininosuccinate synthase